MATKFIPTQDYSSYTQVPFFRRRWFFVTSALLFIPAMLTVAFSGRVYAKQGGKVMRYADKDVKMIAICMSALMAVNIARFLM